MERKLKILLSLPRTLWFNLRYLPFSQALRLPVWLAPNVRVKKMYRGGLVLEGGTATGAVRFGFHEADGVDSCSAHTILSVYRSGRLTIAGDAHIGQGAILMVKDNARLTLGKHFAISGTTSIICSESITFGNDVQLSWNSMIMDSDAHKIYDNEGNLVNPSKPIVIGNKVWIAANTMIAKGSVIQDNTVVASNSLVNKQFDAGNCIIGGQPAKALKSISRFEI